MCQEITTPAELAAELRYRVDERLGLSGYAAGKPVPPELLALVRAGVATWAARNYPDLFAKLKTKTS
jgi:hypothetical protein